MYTNFEMGTDTNNTHYLFANAQRNTRSDFTNHAVYSEQ